MEKKFVKLKNKETVAYLEQGQGNTVLLLVHGNFSSSVYFKPLLDRLPKNIHVYAPDLRGYGDSSYFERIKSLKDFANDLALFMNELKIEKAYVAGWSLGGGVVLELAAHYPKMVEKLILINSTTHKGYPIFKKDALGQVLFGQAYANADEMANDPIQVKPLVDALTSKNFAFVKYIFDLTIYTNKKPSEEDNLLYINESLKQRNLPDADFALASQNMGSTPSLYSMGENTIQLIQMPVLHIWGTLDKTVPEIFILDNVLALKDHSTYIKFDDCAHSPLVDKPEELTKSMLEFIKKQ